MRRTLFFVALLIASCRDDQPVTIEPGGLDFGEVEATSRSPQSRFVKLTNPASGVRVCVIQPLASPFATEQEGEVLVKGLSIERSQSHSCPATDWSIAASSSFIRAMAGARVPLS